MHPPPLLLLGVVAVESATQCQIVGKIAVCPLDHGVRLFVLDRKHAVVIVPCDLCVCVVVVVAVLTLAVTSNWSDFTSPISSETPFASANMLTRWALLWMRRVDGRVK